MNTNLLIKPEIRIIPVTSPVSRGHSTAFALHCNMSVNAGCYSDFHKQEVQLLHVCSKKKGKESMIHKIASSKCNIHQFQSLFQNLWRKISFFMFCLDFFVSLVSRTFKNNVAGVEEALNCCCFSLRSNVIKVKASSLIHNEHIQQEGATEIFW